MNIMTYATIDEFKATDSGKYGKCFELNVKRFLNGNRGNVEHVSSKNHADVHFHGLRLEIKSNCGEINDDIMRNDYIIYTPMSEHDYVNPEQAKVITPDLFIATLMSLGLLRKKTSTNGAERTTIQSYKNSKRKTAAWLAALSQFETLEQFKAEH